MEATFNSSDAITPAVQADHKRHCWQGELLDTQEFNLGSPPIDAAEDARRAAEEEERDQRRLNAAEIKTQLRVQRRLLLSAFLGLDDWSSSSREAQEKLTGVTLGDRLAFVSALIQRFSVTGV